MNKQLVIVESPAKAKTIESFLGSDFKILSSYGHIRDLPRKDLAVDIDNGFKPTYEISADKKKRIQELKKAAKDAEVIWLATDEDREGEAIAWHLVHALGIEKKPVKRIAFHEITKQAVIQAIENPRSIDQNLVDAQQARRVLDRLVGYRLSPLLWKKVQPGLSAGRVQSVAVRLIVEREREIEAFEPVSATKLTAEFKDAKEESLETELSHTLKDIDEAHQALTLLIKANFNVADVSEKPSVRNPAAPFITSTLQQIAARKLGYSVRQTMTLAQRLYEAGHITYMRTDSVTLSKNILPQIKEVVEATFGHDYFQARTFASGKSAQEAHEAIRPTNFKAEQVSSDSGEQRLYDLIRSRALASQMTPAKLDKTTITITNDLSDHRFVANGEVVVFPGWLKAYQDSKLTDTILPPLKAGDTLTLTNAQAKETLKRAPARYSEATLVRKLEAMEIGRPSTYAPTISTIQDRGYVEKGDVAGEERQINVLSYRPGQEIKQDSETLMYGRDKNKLLPTQVALLVNDFLLKYFGDIVDYDFTKEVEAEFDRIAQGKEAWNRMIADFYKPFQDKVVAAESLSREEASGARELGQDPKTGKPIIARMGRFGPMLQLGHAKDDEKPLFAPIPKDKKLHEITLEDALKLFELPLTIGNDTDGEPIQSNYGRFGPYVKSGGIFAPIPKDESPFTVTEDVARKLLAEKRERQAKQLIADFGTVKILDGRFGPYVTNGQKNAKIPKEQDPAKLTLEEATKLLNAPKKRRGKPKKKK